MTEESLLEKTNRVNLLFDFYGELLTEKQRMFLKHYFHEDFTLAEIASAFEISRQAVYEHVKRAESTLEEYEGKLKLLAKHEDRENGFRRLRGLLPGIQEHSTRNQIEEILNRLEQIETGR